MFTPAIASDPPAKPPNHSFSRFPSSAGINDHFPPTRFVRIGGVVPSSGWTHWACLQVFTFG